MPSARARATGAIFVGLMAVSWSAIWIRFCEADAIVIAAGRTLVATLVLLPFFWPKRRSLTALDRSDLLAILLAGVSLAIHFAAWNAAVQNTTLVNAALLINIHPIFLLACERLWMGLRPSRRRLFGTGVALAGAAAIAVASRDSGRHGLAGDLWAILGALTFASYLLLGRRARSRLPLVSQVTVIYGVASLTLIAVALLSGSVLLGLPPATYGYVVLLGLVPTLAGHSAWNYAARHITPSIVAVCALGEPLGAGLLAFWILGERVGLPVIGSGAVLLVGLLLTILPEPPASRVAGA
ncbi:MAG: EamA family transporter [Planctomycetota bacterium]